jgi:hypothetical protein
MKWLVSESLGIAAGLFSGTDARMKRRAALTGRAVDRVQSFTSAFLPW